MKAKEAEPERGEGSGWERQAGGRGTGCVNLLLQTHSAWHSFLECPALLLLLSLLLLPLGLPVLGAPPRLICDSRVLERYILEAREAENVTVRPPPQNIPQNSLSGVLGGGVLQDPGS